MLNHSIFFKKLIIVIERKKKENNLFSVYDPLIVKLLMGLTLQISHLTNTNLDMVLKIH